MATIGVPVTDHYCGDFHVDTSIGLPGSDPCGEMPIEGSCCDDETIFFSVSDHFLKRTFSFEVISIPHIDWSLRPLDEIYSQDNSNKILERIIPPLIEQRIFVRVQSFLL